MSFDTTQGDRGAPSEADLKRIGNAKSHREAYPEQYAHPMVGKRVESCGKTGTVERVVGSRFGQMAHLDCDSEGTFRLLSMCKEVS